jgi:hypothetical protein
MRKEEVNYTKYRSIQWREHPLVPESPKHERMLALAVGV